VLYVDPRVNEGRRVIAGESSIGTAKDLTTIYPPNAAGRMTTTSISTTRATADFWIR